MKAFAVSISASFFARSRHKLMRALRRLSSAVPQLYDLAMCLRGAFGGLLVGSSTGKMKWPGSQILQQVMTSCGAQRAQQNMPVDEIGSPIDSVRNNRDRRG